jgi:hypothetical protein
LMSPGWPFPLRFNAPCPGLYYGNLAAVCAFPPLCPPRLGPPRGQRPWPIHFLIFDQHKTRWRRKSGNVCRTAECPEDENLQR